MALGLSDAELEQLLEDTGGSTAVAFGSGAAQDPAVTTFGILARELTVLQDPDTGIRREQWETTLTLATFRLTDAVRSAAGYPITVGGVAYRVRQRGPDDGAGCTVLYLSKP